MYLIGYVLKPQGIKGEIKINPVSPDIRRYKQLEKIYIVLKNEEQAYFVETSRISNRFVFFKLRNIESRNDAEELRGGEIFIKEKNLIPPADNEFFIHDLIGCQVVSDRGQEIGVIREVMQISSNDVYVIESKSGEEILIPAIKDVIEHVDIANKRVTIHLLEGLVD